MKSNSPEETMNYALSISKKLKPDSVIALTGDLGAGKTTFTKGIAKGLNINESVTSPTFTLIQEYNGDMPMYHMDLYRLNSLDEFEMLGAEDYFYNKGITLIEWSEKAKEILPESTIYIHITVNHDGSRELKIKGANF